jgi:aspartate/methionine/tyrosine aminotransferase
MPEIIDQALIHQAQTIRTGVVAEARTNPRVGGSPLRDMNHLFVKMDSQLEAAQLPEEMRPVNFTIGSVDPRSFGHTADGNIDSLEAEFATLADEMAIDPFSDQFGEIFTHIQQIVQDEWNDPDKPPLTGYDSKAQGRPETRQLYLNGLEKLGFKNLELDGAFLCYGGMDGIIRTIRSLLEMSYQKFNQQHESIAAYMNTLIYAIPEVREKLTGTEMGQIVTMLSENLNIKPRVECGFPVPGFTMVANAIKAEGATPEYLSTKAEERFEFQAEKIEAVLAAHPHMDILIFTPGQNPTTRVMDPENLKNLMANAIKAKPDIKFVFDDAYLELIDPAQANQIVEAIYDSGGFENCVFIFSKSKAEGQPRMRGGLIYAPNKEIRKAVVGDTMRGFPSFSWMTDIYMQALDTYFLDHPQVLRKFRKMLVKRQTTLLNVLKKIDEKNPGAIFTKLKTVSVGEVPLYLFAELANGLTAWELAEKYGIVAAPGEVFGGTPDQVRFALGTNSCSDITKLLSIVN